MFFSDEDIKIVYGCLAILVAAVLTIGVLIGTTCAHNPYRIQIVKEAK